MPTRRLRLSGNSLAKRATSPQASKPYNSVRFVDMDNNAGLSSRATPSSKDLGLPALELWDGVVAEYLQSLSTRKREKALISQAMFDDIWDALQDPSNAKIRTPQFRFWVRKMFKLSFAEIGRAHV